MGCTVHRGDRSRRQPRRGRRGFSLVELLVVITIIILLVTIVSPSLMRARRTARIASCASNLHQIVNSLRCYAGENRELLFPCSRAGSVSEDDLSLLYPDYMRDIDVFRCPDSKYDFPTKAEHIQYKTSRQGTYGEKAQLSYEYPGEYVLGLRRRVDSLVAMLAYDDDGRGTNKVTDEDAHAPNGGNMSFIDGRVDWIKAKDWTWNSWAGLYAWKDPPQRYPRP